MHHEVQIAGALFSQAKNALGLGLEIECRIVKLEAANSHVSSAGTPCIQPGRSCRRFDGKLTRKL